MTDDPPLYPDEIFVGELLALFSRWGASVVDEGNFIRIISPQWDDYDVMVGSLCNLESNWVRVERPPIPPATTSNFTYTTTSNFTQWITDLDTPDNRADPGGTP